MSARPSRFLNEKSGFLGLSIWDMALLGYFLVLSQSALAPLGLDWLAFLVSGLVGYVLVSIRLRFRRKSIRDFLFFQLKSRGL